ncbi:nuclear transport factor 2 family protein [Pedobacter gandavensis]|uniref:nuclear transport factor 2 family protein n=1 Tax=Pedobacter gandavensis TaxID=2679963 RepID=UPI00247A46FE|nr:nuclear transport factor 2 family protein [Pedobacter gandavensis]WGQ10798.1 nuclear transport factor 2 family protein [Pedobacter gandavensis]
MENYPISKHMGNLNRQTLELANAAITEGNYEEFLFYCTQDTQWTFVGEQVLKGKDAVREYMTKVYVEPPKFMVEHLIAEDDFVTAIGKIRMKGEQGDWDSYDYCDVWQFSEGKLHKLTAFVIDNKT